MNTDAPKLDVLGLLSALDGNTSSLKLNSQVYRARNGLAELFEANKLLLESVSPKMCFRNEKEREAYDRIQKALERVGGAA